MENLTITPRFVVTAFDADKSLYESHAVDNVMSAITLAKALQLTHKEVEIAFIKDADLLTF